MDIETDIKRMSVKKLVNLRKETCKELRMSLYGHVRKETLKEPRYMNVRKETSPMALYMMDMERATGHVSLRK